MVFTHRRRKYKPQPKVKKHIVYFIINKPFNMLSQFTDKYNRKTIGKLFDFPKDVYPAGRLDYDSEGLLLLTNNKKIIGRLLDPVKGHEREYLVQVEGIPTEEAIKKLQNGVEIEDYITKPAKVETIEEPQELWERKPPIRYRANIPTSWLRIILTEGKNRQIRKMTAAVGFPTLRLVRIRMCNLVLWDLPNGEVRPLTYNEIRGLSEALGVF
jgi:23S rRNA pseudouridine2457 synthase